MERKTKAQLIIGASLIVLFIIFTVSLHFVDLQPIGPKGSYVAYAGINMVIHEFFGVNMLLYNITDWAGVVAILVAMAFALLGLGQWIKRKSILKVDGSILLLGIFYIIVFGVYVFFEFHAVNCRPFLINGILEASYPSSTTMLAMCVLPTAMLQFRRLIGRQALRMGVNILCALFTLFMLGGRLLCGVHWFTDILGGIIFSAGMFLLYCGVCKCLRNQYNKRSKG